MLQLLSATLGPGDAVQVTGPFGATFLMPDRSGGAAPDDPANRHRLRPVPRLHHAPQRQAGAHGDMVLFFGARSPDALPPLFRAAGEGARMRCCTQHLVVLAPARSAPREYVQDRMMAEQEALAGMLADPLTHIYVCGLRGMEEGVEKALLNIAESAGIPWDATREVMRDDGRFHVETY